MGLNKVNWSALPFEILVPFNYGAVGTFWSKFKSISPDSLMEVDKLCLYFDGQDYIMFRATV